MKKSYFVLLFFFSIAFSFAQDEATNDAISSQLTKGSSLIKSDEIKDFAIYPNPVSNGILRITTRENAKKTIQIFDVLGKQVFSRTIISQHLNISMLHSGMYILRVYEQGKTATRKLIIK